MKTNSSEYITNIFLFLHEDICFVLFLSALQFTWEIAVSKQATFSGPQEECKCVWRITLGVWINCGSGWVARGLLVLLCPGIRAPPRVCFTSIPHPLVTLRLLLVVVVILYASAFFYFAPAFFFFLLLFLLLLSLSLFLYYPTSLGLNKVVWFITNSLVVSSSSYSCFCS